MPKPIDVTTALSYIEEHQSRFGFKPDRLTLTPIAYANVLNFIQGMRKYQSQDECEPLVKIQLMGVPVFFGDA